MPHNTGLDIKMDIPSKDSTHLQLLASQHQRGDAANVARPPEHRAQKAQGLGLDKHIRKSVRNPRQGVPQTDAVDGFTWDAGVGGQED